MNHSLSNTVNSLAIQFKTKKIGNSSILYDAEIFNAPSLRLFSANYHINQDNQQKISPSHKSIATEGGIGRAKVIYFPYKDKTLVLKHYYRGGLVAAIMKDLYIGMNVEKTRSFKELYLLKAMKNIGLPVPTAVAAHVQQGMVTYRADLITQKIDDSKTLADILVEQRVDVSQWVKIGACIKRFHDKNVYHADLNARNILIAESNDVYLIDFDNSYFRVDSKSWKMANVARLKRSLLKCKRIESDFHFDDAGWSSFLKGYNS